MNIKSIPKIRRRWKALSREDRHLHSEALFFLGVSRAAMLFVPFRLIAPRLGRPSVESDPVLSDGARLVAEKIEHIVNFTGNRTAWNSNCMARAITAKIMLRRRHIPSTLYLGVAMDDHQKMVAHAWLRAGDRYITGGDGSKRYAITGKFGDRFS